MNRQEESAKQWACPNLNPQCVAHLHQTCAVYESHAQQQHHCHFDLQTYEGMNPVMRVFLNFFWLDRGTHSRFSYKLCHGGTSNQCLSLKVDRDRFVINLSCRLKWMSWQESMLFVVLCRFLCCSLALAHYCNLDPPISENCTAYLNVFFRRTHFFMVFEIEEIAAFTCERCFHIIIKSLSLILSCA